MSKTKQGGSSRLGRDSLAKRLGIKITAGQKARSGMIIIRQRGSKFVAGENTQKGADDTIYAMRNGVVSFTQKAKKHFDGSKKIVKIVSIKEDK